MFGVMLLVVSLIFFFAGRIVMIIGFIYMSVHVIVGLVVLVYVVVQMAWRYHCDQAILAYGLPEQTTEEQTIATLKRLRSVRGRRDYLQALLARRVPLLGNIPQESSRQSKQVLDDGELIVFRNSGVAEDWAKLREFWLGLSH
ncbi:hypothetical protein SAMN05444166_0362 [Singulisphaera sp. GP187]|nr:hypothetical protein SAMN05444166_0362 [Singulisphaera sp. GP187]